MVRELFLMLAAAALVALPSTDSQTILHAERASTGDLEVGGELAGMPAGATRFIRYEDLLGLPQQTATVSDDANLPANTEISGVSLESLAKVLGSAPAHPLIVAICDDQYRANYPRDYVAAHHPLLVLRINGKPRDQWPPLKDGGNAGPYLISHATFRPSFKVLSHEDEPQIPYGVVRLEFRAESLVFGAIKPAGRWPKPSPVEQGYVIARQDCFRCHNMGAEGGTKAGKSWLQLGAMARDDPRKFQATIRNPIGVNAKATMPAHADYDDATLEALTAYFKTFSKAGRDR